MTTNDPDVIRELEALITRIHELESECAERDEQISKLQVENRRLQSENEELYEHIRKGA